MLHVVLLLTSADGSAADDIVVVAVVVIAVADTAGVSSGFGNAGTMSSESSGFRADSIVAARFLERPSSALAGVGEDSSDLIADCDCTVVHSSGTSAG